MRPLRLLIGGALLAAGLASAAPVPVHMLVPGRGDVLLVVPDGWVQTRETRRAGDPETLSLSQHSGPTFNVVVTAVPVAENPAARPDMGRVRAFVAEAAKEAESQSVEKELPVRDFPGAKGRGVYFTATDRAPKPNEWKYLAQGAITVDSAILTFTILTNDGQDAIVTAALEMLRRATLQPPPVPTG